MACGGASSAGLTEAQMAQRLEDAELEAVRETKEQAKKLEEVKEEYEKLKTTLRRLPEELTHDIMVPMGKKAFMPGKLVHTNEILVLLGENWFVETSASRASDIADRRLERLNEMIAQTEKQREMFENRNSFTKDVAGTLRSDGDEREIREEYVSADFAAIREKKRRRSAETKPETRDQLTARARKAMAKCEEEDGETRRDDNLPSVLKQRQSPLKERPHFRDMPISERDWEERLKKETDNEEMNKIVADDDAKTIVERRIKEEADDYYDEDDERYDDEKLTDDEDEDDEDDEDDDEDVPIVPFGNLGKPRPSKVEDRTVEEEEEEEEGEDDDVPIVAFGNLGKPKSEIVTPPNVSRTISLTGSNEDEDTPRTRERKRLTWATGVEDNDAEKCDAFGSRLKALFNSYKDEEIIVSDEEEEEEQEEKANDGVSVDVDTVRIFIKHTRSNDKTEPSSNSDQEISSRRSPRHPGDIKASFATSKTTFKELGEKSRQSRLEGESGGGNVDNGASCLIAGSEGPRETPPSSAPSTPAEPKSILKKKGRKSGSPKFDVPEDSIQVPRSSRFSPTNDRSSGKIEREKSNRAVVVAVAEEIKEREPTISTDDNLINSPSGRTASPASDSFVPKRVSKFKQQRQNRS